MKIFPSLLPKIEDSGECPFQPDSKIIKTRTEVILKSEKLKEIKLNLEKLYLNKQLDTSIENEENIELCSKNLIKLLLDKYSSNFDYMVK